MNTDTLVLIAKVIRKTNSNLTMCDPTVPQWTGHFAELLLKELKSLPATSK